MNKEIRNREQFNDYMVDKGIDDLHLKIYMKIVWNHQQKKIDAQAKEIEILKNAIIKIAAWDGSYGLFPEVCKIWGLMALNEARKLIDKNLNPTNLLTGKK